MKIFLTALSLIIFPVLIESCCLISGDSCCGNKTEANRFSISDISMTVGVRYSTPYQLAPHSIAPSNMEFFFEMDTKAAYAPSYRPTMAAYACDPAIFSKEKLASYSIVSDNILESDLGTFAAGENLSSVFFLTDGGEDTPFHGNQFYLYPSFTVKDAAEHAFIFNFTLDDGRTFEFESSTFELLPQ